MTQVTKATPAEPGENLPPFFLAIDDSDPAKVLGKLELVTDVPGRDWGVKINLDAFLTRPYLVEQIQARTDNRSIFVDMKMWNGKRTMTSIVRMLAYKGVAMTNAYAMADRLLEEPARIARESGIALFGVTVLTHYNDAYCQEYFRRSLRETVQFLAQKAMDLGCCGYILPGTMLDAVAGIGGKKFNPATRPSWMQDKQTNDQEQLSTPEESFAGGTDIVSCGSPVFKSSSPRDTLEQILVCIRRARTEY